MAEVIGRALIRVLPQTAEFAVHLRNDLKRTFQTITDSFAVLGTQALAGAAVALGGAAFNLAGAFGVVPAAAASATVALGALAVGFQGVGKAIKDAGDPKKFAKDLQKLSPEARKAAIAVKDLGIQAGAFRVAVQDALFKDLDQTITKLGNTLLPGVKKNFVEIASAVNDGARAFALFVGSKQTLADINNLFTNTKTSLKILAPAGIAFSSAIRDIVSVGSNFLPIIAGAITSVTERFSAFIAKARDSGQLSAFFAKGIETLHTLIDIFKNLGQTILSIFQTASDAGAGLLQSIDNVTKSLKDFFTSAPGQSAVTDFLTSAKDAALALGPVLKAVALLFATGIAPVLATIGKILGPSVTEFVNSLAGALKIAEPGIEALAQGFSAIVRGLAPALPAIGQLADVIGRNLGQVLEALAPTLEKVVSVLADALTQALSDPSLIEGLIAIGKAFGDLIIALAPVLPSLAELAGIILKALADVLSAIAPVLADVIKQFVDALLPFMPGLVQAFIDFVQAVLPLVTDLLPVLLDIMRVLLPVIKPVVEIIVVFLKIAEPIIKAVAAIAEALLDLIKGIEKTVEFVSNVFQFFFGVLTGATNASDVFTNKIAGQAVPAVTEALGAAGTALDETKVGIGQFVVSMFQANTDVTGASEQMAKGTADSFAAMTTSAQVAAVNLVSALFPSFDQLAAKGAGAFSGIADAANRAFLVTVKQSRDALIEITHVFVSSQPDFGAAGSALIGSFADGIAGERARLLLERAARQAIAVVAAFFPHSPAEVGPFSGSGWTPFRGLALVEGFAQGITSGAGTLNTALSGLFNTASAQLGSSTAVPTTSFRAGAFGSSASVGRTASSASSSSGAAAGGDVTEVHVFIGEQELTQLVTGVVVKNNRDTRRKALAGTGRAR